MFIKVWFLERVVTLHLGLGFLRIDSGGNVGIGTDTKQVQLGL